MRACAVAGLVAGVMLAPWAIRKQHALGAPIATSTNGGFNLLMGSYREGRYAPMEEGIDCPEGLGEFEADRCRLARASARIAARPGDAIARSLLRLEHTFGHESAAAEVWATSIEAREPTQASARLWALGIARPTWHLLVLGGIAGAVVLALRRRRSAGPCGVALVALVAPIAGTALLHAVVIGGDRYHAQCVPMIAALAGVAGAAGARAWDGAWAT